MCLSKLYVKALNWKLSRETLSTCSNSILVSAGRIAWSHWWDGRPASLSFEVDKPFKTMTNFLLQFHQRKLKENEIGCRCKECENLHQPPETLQPSEGSIISSRSALGLQLLSPPEHFPRFGNTSSSTSTAANNVTAWTLQWKQWSASILLHNLHVRSKHDYTAHVRHQGWVILSVSIAMWLNRDWIEGISRGSVVRKDCRVLQKLPFKEFHTMAPSCLWWTFCFPLTSYIFPYTDMFHGHVCVSMSSSLWQFLGGKISDETNCGHDPEYDPSSHQKQKSS